MKIVLFLFLLTLSFVCSSPAIAEDFDLFEQSVTSDLDPIGSANTLVSPTERLIARGTYNNSIGNIVSSTSVINLNMLGESTSFRVTNVVRKSSTRVSYTASNSKTNTLSVSENAGKVVGSLWQGGKLYKLRSAPDGSTLLIEVSNESLIDHPIDYQENVDPEQDNVDSKDEAPIASPQTDSAGQFTVIVAYTSAFASVAGSVPAYMDLLELETNTAFSNSGVNTSVKIVHSYETNYADSNNFYTDRDYFLNGANLYAAELYALRDKHRADLMILLTGNGYSFCGLASGIGVTEDTAFAVASETCAVGYYSFGHEIGHLFGARHIISQDPTPTPFSYGHGYCNTTASTWRTVMAYNCPSNTGGPRIQQWSNPYVSLGEDPTGSVALEHNARVFNERASAIANFRTEEDFLLLLVPNIISAGNKKN